MKVWPLLAMACGAVIRSGRCGVGHAELNASTWPKPRFCERARTRLQLDHWSAVATRLKKADGDRGRASVAETADSPSMHLAITIE